MAQVEFKNLKKSFGDVEVVKQFDLTVNDGEFLVLLGPSGCGKSTILRMLAGLEDITSGDVIVGNRIVNDVDAKDRDLAMVFQSYALYPHMTVYENIAFALKLKGMKKPDIDAEVRKAAKMLELEPLLDRKPKELSGGQRQRVAMGRAMVRTPKVFLFDEPLSNLDAKLRGTMRDEIKALHNALGTTTIYVTHDQIEAMTLANRVVILKDGYIEQVGTPEDVFRHPANEFVAQFIGNPSMNLLDGKIERHGEEYLVKVGNETITLPQRFHDKIRSGQAVRVGIRPTDIYLRTNHIDHQQVQSFNVKIEDKELLGANMLLKAYLGGQKLLVETNVVDIQSDVVDIVWDLNELHLFDKDNGRSLATLD
ncbi:ABC transporter ATP-binding protein [Vibrio gangliei]|uniref:ABC transporter ATP-binding protein n=1 Tax=Vibrio gangliei TaxID=2077090 RepID=UPI000D01CAF2|nr:sn-glycerol-3-phosphate ABC transporter ATP-binding protein UgpC [Vibrio gangliei]